MATAIPSQAWINVWFNDPKRRAQLVADNDRLQLEDYRTVSTDRGPVRGYGGGSARRR